MDLTLRELFSRNAAALVDPPSVPCPEFRALTPQEARRFLDAVKGDRLEALYAVAVALGLRQGEALGLTWVELDRGELRVRRTLVKLNGQLYRLSEPKTKRSRRTLPMTPSLVAQLRAHRNRRRIGRLAAGERWQGEEWGLIFCTTLGGPLSKSTVIKQLKIHLQAAGLPDMRYHDLRHCCASLLVAQGVHPRMVMEILGHSTIVLTMNTYSHVMPSAQRDAALLIESAIFEASD